MASPSTFAVSFARDDEASGTVEQGSPGGRASPRHWETARSALKAAQRLASPTRTSGRASSPVLSRRVAAVSGAEKRARGFRLSDPVFNDPTPVDSRDGGDTAKGRGQQPKKPSRVTLLPMHKEDAGGIDHILDSAAANDTNNSNINHGRNGGGTATASSIGLHGALVQHAVSHEITAFETAATATCPYHASQGGGGGSQPLPRYNPAAWRLSREVEDAPTSTHAAAHFTYGFTGVFHRPAGDDDEAAAVAVTQAPSRSTAGGRGHVPTTAASKSQTCGPPQQSGVYCHGALGAHEFYLPAQDEPTGDAASEHGGTSPPPPVDLTAATATTPPAAPAPDSPGLPPPPSRMPEGVGARHPPFCLAQGYLPVRDAAVVAADARKSFDTSMAEERSKHAAVSLELESSRLLHPASVGQPHLDDDPAQPTWTHARAYQAPSDVLVSLPHSVVATDAPRSITPVAARLSDDAEQPLQEDETCALCGLSKLGNPTCAKSGRPHRLGVHRRFGAPTLTPLQRDRANRAASSSSSSLLRSDGR